MDHLFPHQVTISWEVTVVEVTPEGKLSPVCQNCRLPLNLHQPDESHPNRLLGTCGECSTWFLIEVGSKGIKSLMFNMPGVNYVREKLKELRPPSRKKRPSRARPE